MKKTFSLLVALMCCFFISFYAQGQGTYTSIFGGGGSGVPNASGPATSSPLGYPFNIAMDGNGNIYYADYVYHILTKVDTAGMIHRIMGDPSDGSWSGDGGPATAARFHCVEGLTTDARGNVYFLEGCISPSPIRMIDTAGIVNTIYAGNQIFSISSDAAGNILFTDGNEVLIRTASGSVTTIAGSSTAGYSGDGGPATAATLNLPIGATFDAAGNVYIADMNSVIRKVNMSTGIITTIAGNGSPTLSGDGGFAINAGIGNYISSLRFDAYGNLHLNANFGGSRVINRAGIINASPYTLYGDPGDILFDPSGSIYLLNGYKFTPDAVASSSSFYLNLEHNCSGPQVTVVSSVFDTTRKMITEYGDGSADTVDFVAGTFGTTNYALSSHHYLLAGSYTIKNTIYNWGGRIDSFATSYMHLPCSVIHLQSYADANNNCNYDTATEILGAFPISIAVDSNGIPLDTVSLTGGTYYTAYGSAGDVYSFRPVSLPAGTAAGCSSSGFVADTFTVYGDNSRTLGIGLQCSSTTGYDLAVSSIHGAGRHTQLINAAVSNNYCTPTSGTLSITFSPKYHFSSSIPSPTSVSGQTATWNLSSLSAITGQRNISLHLEVPATWLSTGDTALSTIVITSSGGDLDSTNNKIVIIDTIRSSFDPNFISVNPEGNILSGTKLQYAIEFENDGNDTAKNIYVLDTLPSGVNPSTLTMISASKPMNISSYSFGANTVVKFDFPNVNLLDSSHHGLCTGNFIFNINTRSGLSAGTILTNRVGIYFDDNPVVMTNEVHDVITMPSISISSMGTVCTGDTMHFTATGPGISNTTYRWQVNGAATGPNSATFASSTLTTGDLVRCLLWDNTGDTLLATSSNIVVSFSAMPTAGTITGTTTVCAGATTTLSAATGGTWSSASASTASVSTTGVVTGVAAGGTTISYSVTNSCGTDVATTTVTINPLPSAGSLSGTTTACAGATTTLTPTVAGGSWTTSAASTASVSAGVITGAAAGSATISYSVTNSCGTDVTSVSVTVIPLPSAGTITGITTVCVAASTALSAATGGSWSSASTSIASVSSTGVVSGIAAGSTTISYSVTNSCGTDVATAAVTVNPLPSAGTLSGTTTVCAGATTSLSSTVTGGSWSSSATSTASVSGGVVTGVAAGSATISYSMTNSCGTDIATAAVAVNPLPVAGTITGSDSVCVGSSITLGAGASSGTTSTWTLTNSSATISGTVVTGAFAGTDTAIHTSANSCGTVSATKIITVMPLPDPGTITGADSVCAGSTITLTESITGGSWSITGTSATVASGVVTGVSAGTSSITYSVTNYCGTGIRVHPVVTNPLPVAGSLSGTTTICVGGTTTITPSITGGTWTSSITTTATVDAAGLVTGVAAGVVTISYTVANSCGSDIATTSVTINPPPVAGSISGLDSVCVGDTIVLTDGVTGGAWSSSNTSIASISGTGGVMGIASGSATITYNVTNTCGSASATHNVYVKSIADCNTGVGSQQLTAGSPAVYPNPNNGSFVVDIPTNSTNVTIMVTDVSGKVISRIQPKNASGLQVPVELGGVARGTYLLNISIDGKSYHDKVIVW